MLEKITKFLGITIPSHIMRSKDPRALMTTIFSAWLPLSTAVLVSVVEQLPSPVDAQAQRCPDLISQTPGATHIDPRLKDAITNFRDSASDPAVAYVSKMVSIPVTELPQNKRKKGASMTAEEARELARRKRTEIAKTHAAASGVSNEPNGITDAFSSASLDSPEPEVGPEEVPEEPEELIGFARLYSGMLSVGDSMFVLPPKYSPANPNATARLQEVTVTALYMLMGRSLEALSSVPAGVIFGIGGLGGRILKSGTLCSQAEGAINLAGVTMGGEPIVRVAVEPDNPIDLDKMIAGLKLLEQSDACARYEVLENGEHVILVAGELHLERCLKDLRERFARCEVQVSEPLVPYRETIVSVPDMAAPRSKDLPRGTVVGVISSKQLSFRVRVRPMPEQLTEFLQKHSQSIRRLYAEKKTQEDRSKEGSDATIDQEDADGLHEILDNEDTLTLHDFKKGLRNALRELKDRKEFWTNAVEKISAFGPKRIGPNALIDATRDALCGKL